MRRLTAISLGGACSPRYGAQGERGRVRHYAGLSHLRRHYVGAAERRCTPVSLIIEKALKEDAYSGWKSAYPKNASVQAHAPTNGTMYRKPTISWSSPLNLDLQTLAVTQADTIQVVTISPNPL